MTTLSHRSEEPGWPHGSPGFYVAAAIVYVISLAATIYFCVSMSGGMDMPGGWTMSMMWMGMPGRTWLDSAGMFLLMWLAMMVAMMLPSALPMLAGFHRAFLSEGRPRPGASTAIVAAGYFAAI